MDQTVVWRALGDPTRREILDLLGERPRTTGELAAQFEQRQSRYGVMKHLSVLEAASLITVRREGRVRWNHLNAVPLREIYERWLGRYQEFWSSSMLRLRDHLAAEEQVPKEVKEEEPMSATFHSFEIDQEITLDAPPAQVWAALTNDIGKWWAFHVGEEGSTISLDPHPGGRFEERWGDGEGVIWGEVIDLRHGKRIRLQGCLGMSGAGSNDYVYEIEAVGADKTLLKLSHHAYGHRDPETEQRYTEGWQGLLHKYLPAWLHERKTAAELDAEQQK